MSCRSILLRMDNKNSSVLEYLQSRAGKQAVVDTHVEGIVEYLSA